MLHHPDHLRRKGINSLVNSNMLWMSVLYWWLKGQRTNIISSDFHAYARQQTQLIKREHSKVIPSNSVYCIIHSDSVQSVNYILGDGFKVTKRQTIKPEKEECMRVFPYMNIRARGCSTSLGEVITDLFICVLDMQYAPAPVGLFTAAPWSCV